MHNYYEHYEQCDVFGHFKIVEDSSKSRWPFPYGCYRYINYKQQVWRVFRDIREVLVVFIGNKIAILIVLLGETEWFGMNASKYSAISGTSYVQMVCFNDYYSFLFVTRHDIVYALKAALESS